MSTIMCGGYRLSRRKQVIEEYFGSAPWDDDWNPRYNIAPTQSIPVIRQHPKEPIRQISTMRWGLIPHWAKDASIATGTINAKSETAATKPAFRHPLKFRRCLIPRFACARGHVRLVRATMGEREEHTCHIA
jgi:putative SOS response-associated peptidase YedK